MGGPARIWSNRADASDRRAAPGGPVLWVSKLAEQLKREGHDVGRRHVRTLMQRMGIEALYRKPDTSIPRAGRKFMIEAWRIDYVTVGLTRVSRK